MTRNRAIRPLAISAVILTLGSFFCSYLASCTSVRGFARLDDMTSDEFNAFAAGWEMRFQRLTETALASGDLETEEARSIAAVIEAVATGTVAGTLSEGFRQFDLPMTGWTLVLLWEAVYELDQQLLTWEAYQEKFERLNPLLLRVARGIKAGAGVAPDAFWMLPMRAPSTQARDVLEELFPEPAAGAAPEVAPEQQP